LFSSGGVVNGWVPKHGGALQVLRAGKKCPKGDTALPFEAPRPAGAAGSKGTNGSAGLGARTGPPAPTAPTAARDRPRRPTPS
jgi:hypothetical protein